PAPVPVRVGRQQLARGELAHRAPQLLLLPGKSGVHLPPSIEPREPHEPAGRCRRNGTMASSHPPVLGDAVGWHASPARTADRLPSLCHAATPAPATVAMALASASGSSEDTK